MFIRGRKLNISIVFITRSYFKVPKDVRLDSTHFLIIIPNIRELQQIVLNHSSCTDFKDFIKIYKRHTAKLYSFLVNDTTLPSDNSLRFRKKLFNGRNDVIKFIESYGPKILESKRLAKQGTGLKILIPKQMLQRLPIALAQVKAGNNSESLLNEIRQIVYSLYQSK